MAKTYGELKTDEIVSYDYTVLDAAGRTALTGMSVGDTIFQRDTGETYIADSATTAKIKGIQTSGTIPTVTDDTNAGYNIGDIIQVTTTDPYRDYVCTDNTAGAAVWNAKPINHYSNTAPTVTDDLAAGYLNGDTWTDTSTTPYTEYELSDNTNSAAVWSVPTTSNENIISSTFLAGDNLTKGQYVTYDTNSTFSDISSSNNIGDSKSNTKFGLKQYGNGISSNTLKLGLKKTGTPTVDLGIRIETDNAGKPSGTLIDTNAIGTVTEASLTTTITDTIITLNGNITIPLNTKVWIILFQGTYGSEVTDSVNYYNIGLTSLQTSNRQNLKYIESNVYTDSFTGNTSYAAPTGKSGYRGISFTANKNITYLKFNTMSGGAANKAKIRDSSGNDLYTITYDSSTDNIFTGINLVQGVTYQLVMGRDSGTYNYIESDRIVFSNIGITFNSFINSINTSGQLSPFGIYNIITYESVNDYSTENTNNTYVYSTLFNDKLMILATSLNYNTLYGAVVTDSVVGNSVDIITTGIDNTHTGLTSNTTYYLSDTPGVISTSSGTNTIKVGDSIDDTKINISSNIIGFSVDSSNTVSISFNQGTGVVQNTNSILTTGDAFLNGILKTITTNGGGVNGTLTIQTSNDDSTWNNLINISSLNNNDTNTINAFIPKGVYVRGSLSCPNTAYIAGSAYFTLQY